LKKEIIQQAMLFCLYYQRSNNPDLKTQFEKFCRKNKLNPVTIETYMAVTTAAINNDR